MVHVEHSNLIKLALDWEGLKVILKGGIGDQRQCKYSSTIGRGREVGCTGKGKRWKGLNAIEEVGGGGETKIRKNAPSST